MLSSIELKICTTEDPIMFDRSIAIAHTQNDKFTKIAAITKRGNNFLTP